MLILMVLGLIFVGLAVISGTGVLFILCFPSYIDQLINYSVSGILDFESWREIK